ncbi:MAG TPA: InlB B-repeat-containing protein, partial [Spirochaetota bacterium]|nr:InlB B-repeat-containing protein [Spirochaetota bacterium]
ADCETNGTAFGYYATNINTKTVTGLPGGTYYFNVVVRDNSGNKACYTAAGPLNLFKVTYDGNGAASGSAPVDANIYTNGQTVTVLGEGTLAKTHDGINLRVACWNTQSDGMGTDYQPGATFTIGTANVTLYAKWTALKCYGPAGGLIFYDKGNYDNGWRYMEAAPSSTEWDSEVWGGYGTAVPGADGTTTGSGKQNTIDIVAQYGAAEPYQSKTDYAAKLCADLSHNSYNDWFLPSKGELEQMFVVLENVVGFALVLGDWYWSSTENDANKSCATRCLTAGGGIETGYINKGDNCRVRAVRSFLSF